MPQALLVERVPRRDLPLIPSSATATEEVAKTRQKQRQWGGGGGGDATSMQAVFVVGQSWR